MQATASEDKAARTRSRLSKINELDYRSPNALTFRTKGQEFSEKIQKKLTQKKGFHDSADVEGKKKLQIMYSAIPRKEEIVPTTTRK
jgi:hypothetical protein